MSTVDVLGHTLDIDASAATAIDHRLGAMAAHLWDRPELRFKPIPLLKRVGRYDQTVRATMQYAAGTFRLTHETAQRLQNADRRQVRSIWRPKKRVDESWEEWHRRSFRGAGAITLAAGASTLLERVLRAQHQWAGHLGRMGPDTWVAILSQWRDSKWWKAFQAEWQRVDPVNSTQWRHPRRGDHHRWDTALVAQYGPEWRTKTVSREDWKRLEDSWVFAEHARLLPSRYPALER